MSTQKLNLVPSTRGQAFIGSLPFVGFGLISMLGKLDRFHEPSTIYIYLVFYGLTLTGLLIGWTRGFPLWSYSYLGWTFIFLWWLAGARINGGYWGIGLWILLVIMILIALIWTHSLAPLKKLFSDIANDWSRLSLAIYTFIAFIFLIYDENHHPYLLIFMATATAVISAGAWFFLRSSHLQGRILSMLGGLTGGYLIGTICDNTWDAAAYYNLPKGPPDPWYQSAYKGITILAFLSLILLWPTAISLYQQINKGKTASR